MRAARVGSLSLKNAVMTAAGTSGHGAELADYLDLAALGAHVVKSLATFAHEGNPAPRLAPVTSGMLNSVGLQGPGLQAWIERDLPELVTSGASVVVSIWGRRVEDYAAAAELLADAPPCVVAVEVNVSCPNVEDRLKMFAHSPVATAEVLEATAPCRRPRWAKLSPNVTDITEIAGAALGAGAEAVTLVNTLIALDLELETRRPVLGAGGGGLSGPALRPVALRAVYDTRGAFPDAAIIGVGGITSGADAFKFLLAGANAVQVGTATLAEPRAAARILGELEQLLDRAGIRDLSEIVGAARPERTVAEEAISGRRR